VAAAMIVNGQVVLLADKTGESVDIERTAAAVKAGYGHSAKINATLHELVR